jgi:chaperonin GroES
MNLRLLGNRVLLCPIVRHQNRADSIILPQTYTDPQTANQFRVLAVGPGKRSKHGAIVPHEVKPGDYVLFKDDFDNITLYDGRKVVNADQILARWRYE